MRRLSLLLLPILVNSLIAEPIPPDQVAELRKVIRPAADEDRWALIPWRTSLWEARKEAAKTGKPILLWEMDGHPLGCT